MDENNVLLKEKENNKKRTLYSSHIKINTLLTFAISIFAAFYMFYPKFNSVEGGSFFILYLTSFLYAIPFYIFFSFSWVGLLSGVGVIASIGSIIMLIIAIKVNTKTLVKNLVKKYIICLIFQAIFIVFLMGFGIRHFNGLAANWEFETTGPEFMIIAAVMAALLVAQVIHFVFIRKKIYND